MSAAAIAGGALPVAGGLIGQAASSGDVSQSEADLQQALQNIQNVQVPGIAEQEWNLAQEQQQGLLSPEAEATMQMGPNALAGIQTNPAYSQAQMQALQQLGQLGQGGLTAAEKQNLIQANLAASGQAQSQNAAVAQQMAARGMGGSGVQLAMQLANNQNAANQQAQQGNAINAMAQQNALGAIAQQGGLAGQMQAQQFGQQAAVAQAQNAINQFNAMNAQNVAGYNTQAQNQAQASNLGNQQNIANTNVGLQNQQQAHNTGLYQQQFADQMQQAQAEAGILGSQANQQMGLAQQTAGMWSGIGSGLGSAANAYGMSNAISGLNPSSSSGGYSSSPGFNSTATSGNNWGAGTYSMPSFGGFAQGGMIAPPDYNKGGEVHNNVNLEQLKKAFSKFISEEEKESGYAEGGNVLDQFNTGDESGPQIVWDEQVDDSKKDTKKPPVKEEKKYSGGNVGYPGSRSSSNLGGSNASLQPTYAEGGQIRPHKGPAHEPKGQVAKPKNPPSVAPYMNHGGEVSTLGMNSYDVGGLIQRLSGGGIPVKKQQHYDEGGMITPQDLAPYMPSKAEEEASGFPPGPQRASYIAMRKYNAANNSKQGYAGGGDVIGLSGHAGMLPLPNSKQVHKMGYADGGMTGPAVTPQQISAAVNAGDYTLPQAIVNAQKSLGTVGQAVGYPGSTTAPTQVKAYPPGKFEDPEDAAEYGQMITAQQHAPQTDINALAKAAAAQQLQKALQQKQLQNQIGKTYPAIEPGMYEGGNLRGLPHEPEPKSPDSYDAEQYGMKGMSSGGKMGMNLGVGMEMSKGGPVEAKVSPQERYYTPKQTDRIISGQEKPKETGIVFPGKAPIKGDSPKNDIISTKLQTGGIVVPRSISKKSDDEILDFVKKAREGKR